MKHLAMFDRLSYRSLELIRRWNGCYGGGHRLQVRTVSQMNFAASPHTLTK